MSHSTADRRRSDRSSYEKINYEIHLSRVRAAKGTIDSKPPRPHPLTNRADMDQRRKHAAIEYDNKLLLERLATIVQSKTVDTQIQQSTAIHATFKVEMLRHKKKLEIQRITTENQRILRRLQEVPPAYNHAEWDEHARISEKNKRSMALYPEYYDKSDKISSKNTVSISPPPRVQSSSEKTFKVINIKSTENGKNSSRANLGTNLRTNVVSSSCGNFAQLLDKAAISIKESVKSEKFRLPAI